MIYVSLIECSSFVKYLGEAEYVGYHETKSKDYDGNMRIAYQFKLRPTATHIQRKLIGTPLRPQLSLHIESKKNPPSSLIASAAEKPTSDKTQVKTEKSSDDSSSPMISSSPVPPPAHPQVSVLDLNLDEPVPESNIELEIEEEEEENLVEDIEEYSSTESSPPKNGTISV